MDDCKKCAHKGWLTMDDVASCNCCEDGEFFEPLPEPPQDGGGENE